MKRSSIGVSIFIALCIILSIITIQPTQAANSKCEVIFSFDGLQVLAFGDSKRVSDGILDVHHHAPLIEIKQVREGKETLIRTVKASELKGKSLNIDIPSNKLEPSRYYSPDMQKDKKDFRWCLDLETDLFQKQLYLKQDKLFAKIHFNVGAFFAASVTDEKYKFTSGSKIHSFNREIGAPGARLELHQGDNLLIAGLDREMTLPYQIGVNYKIDVTNLPPPDMASVDHFAFYYDVVKENVDRFMPVMMVEKSAFYPKPLLCEAVILGKSKIN